jgi:hypothetical protein
MKPVHTQSELKSKMARSHCNRVSDFELWEDGLTQQSLHRLKNLGNLTL